MNKRIIAALLALVMVLAMAACGAKTPAETQAPETQAPETQAPTTEAPAPVELGKIAVFNTAQADMAFTTDAEARFNSVWMPAYSVAEYVAANFWFAPTEETPVGVTSWQDGYTWEQTYATFANQFLSIEIDASMVENHEVVVCGEGSGDEVHPWHVGWITVGAEAMIFVPKNGYTAQYLFEDMGMVAAEEYDFVCSDGFSETIHKDDLANVEIFFSEESNSIECTSIAFSPYTLQNLQYIIPTGMEQGAEAPAEGVAKINVFATGAANLTAVDAYYGGSTPEAFSVKELLEMVGMTSGSEVTITSYLDDDPETIPYDNFAQRYITLDNSKERQPYTLGKVQPKSEYVKNAGYFVIDGTNAILYVPETYVEGAGMPLTDVLAFLGMEKAASVDIVCADGYVENVTADKFAEVTLFHTAGRLDANSVANPEYTLMNTLYIIPKG